MSESDKHDGVAQLERTLRTESVTSADSFGGSDNSPVASASADPSTPTPVYASNNPFGTSPEGTPEGTTTNTSTDNAAGVSTSADTTVAGEDTSNAEVSSPAVAPSPATPASKSEEESKTTSPAVEDASKSATDDTTVQQVQEASTPAVSVTPSSPGAPTVDKAPALEVSSPSTPTKPANTTTTTTTGDNASPAAAASPVSVSSPMARLVIESDKVPPSPDLASKSGGGGTGTGDEEDPMLLLQRLIDAADTDTYHESTRKVPQSVVMQTIKEGEERERRLREEAEKRLREKEEQTRELEARLNAELEAEEQERQRLQEAIRKRREEQDRKMLEQEEQALAEHKKRHEILEREKLKAQQLLEQLESENMQNQKIQEDLARKRMAKEEEDAQRTHEAEEAEKKARQIAEARERVQRESAAAGVGRGPGGSGGASAAAAVVNPDAAVTGLAAVGHSLNATGGHGMTPPPAPRGGGGGHRADYRGGGTPSDNSVGDPTIPSAAVTVAAAGGGVGRGEDVTQWDTARVLLWLDEIKYAKYADKFNELAIDGELLVSLTDTDLESDLEVASALARKKLLLEIRKLQDHSHGQGKDEDGPAVLSWSVAQVGEWLQGMNLHQHVASFASHQIDGARLVDLTDVQMAGDLGVTSGIVRRRVANAIKKLLDQTSSMSVGSNNKGSANSILKAPGSSQPFGSPAKNAPDFDVGRGVQFAAQDDVHSSDSEFTSGTYTDDDGDDDDDDRDHDDDDQRGANGLGMRPNYAKEVGLPRSRVRQNTRDMNPFSNPIVPKLNLSKLGSGGGDGAGDQSAGATAAAGGTVGGDSTVDIGGAPAPRDRRDRGELLPPEDEQPEPATPPGERDQNKPLPGLTPRTPRGAHSLGNRSAGIVLTPRSMLFLEGKANGTPVPQSGDPTTPAANSDGEPVSPTQEEALAALDRTAESIQYVPEEEAGEDVNTTHNHTINESLMSLPYEPCAVCDAYPADYMCGQCNQVSYCSAQCQEVDWKTHYVACLDYVKTQYKKLQHAATQVQRVYRGHLARSRYKILLSESRRHARDYEILRKLRVGPTGDHTQVLDWVKLSDTRDDMTASHCRRTLLAVQNRDHNFGSGAPRLKIIFREWRKIGVPPSVIPQEDDPSATSEALIQMTDTDNMSDMTSIPGTPASAAPGTGSRPARGTAAVSGLKTMSHEDVGDGDHTPTGMGTRVPPAPGGPQAIQLLTTLKAESNNYFEKFDFAYASPEFDFSFVLGPPHVQAMLEEDELRELVELFRGLSNVYSKYLIELLEERNRLNERKDELDRVKEKLDEEVLTFHGPAATSNGVSAFSPLSVASSSNTSWASSPGSITIPTPLDQPKKKKRFRPKKLFRRHFGKDKEKYKEQKQLKDIHRKQAKLLQAQEQYVANYVEGSEAGGK